MKHFNHGTVKGSLEATKVAGGLKETIITNKDYWQIMVISMILRPSIDVESLFLGPEETGMERWWMLCDFKLILTTNLIRIWYLC